MISISGRRAKTLRRMVLPTVMMLTTMQHQHDHASALGDGFLDLHKDIGHLHRGGNADNARDGLHLHSGVQYVSKQDVLNTYRGYMQDYSSLWDEFETDNPFKANYRVTLSDLTQMRA